MEGGGGGIGTCLAEAELSYARRIYTLSADQEQTDVHAPLVYIRLSGVTLTERVIVIRPPRSLL